MDKREEMLGMVARAPSRSLRQETEYGPVVSLGGGPLVQVLNPAFNIDVSPQLEYDWQRHLKNA
eukprot:12112653-Prorocentrum_lima.AAC.1